MKKSILIFFCFITTVNFILAQTGAGGVGSSATNIIWLDANSINQANGTQVSIFQDLSGNGNNLSQATSTKQPTFNTTSVNGLPGVQFDGVNDLLARGATPALESANLTYYIVFKRATLTNQMLITAAYASSPTKWRTYCNASNNNLISAQYSPSITHVSYSDPGTPTFVSTHITPTQIRLYRQGVQQMVKTATYTVPTGHQNLALGNFFTSVSPTTYALNGFVAEVIVYNSALNNLERVIVENYLGAKYNMAIPTDLYSFQGTHNIGLIAVGNNAVNSQTVAKGAGVVQISNPSSLGSNEYLMTAHTNIDLTDFTTADIPASITGYSRWTRTWRVEETGNVGTTDLTFYLSGGNNFAPNSSTYTLLVDSDGNFSNATQITGVYNGVAETVTFNVDLNTGDFFTLAGLIETIEIHAINTGLWSDVNTWDCTCIPNANSDVYIDPNVAVTVDIDGSVNYFSIGDPGGVLIMNSNNTISIYGDWDLLGSVQLNAGRIAMVGPVNQYIDAGGATVNFNDLEINNSGGADVLLFESQYILNGTLFPISGSLTLDPSPGNEFILASTNSGTQGRIDEVVAPFTFNGTFKVQRFIQSGLADFRNICSPLVGSTFQDWDPNLAMSGPGFPDGCAVGPGEPCYHSVTYYHNNTLFKVANVTDPITNGRGYEVYMGDNLNTFSGTTLTSVGQLNDYNDIAKSYNTGWSIIGNPYASPILYSSTTRTSQISNYFYVYDASIGDYQYYDGNSGLGSIPEFDAGRMSIGQGAWIFATSLGSITYQQSNKTNTGTFIRSSGLIDENLYLKLKEQNSTYYGTLVLQENTNTFDGNDSLFDMRHLSTGEEAGPGFAIIADDILLKKNYIRSDFRNKSFDIHTQIRNAGYYTIEISNFENFRDYRKILIYDSESGEFINLKKELSYTFYSDEFEGHRFTLILTNEEVEEESTIQSLTINEAAENGVTLTQMGHTFNLNSDIEFSELSTVSLVNLLGQQEVFTQSLKVVKGSNLITVPETYKGVHILVITTGDERITKKVVL